MFSFEGIPNRKHQKLTFEKKIDFWKFDHCFVFNILNITLIVHEGNKCVIGNREIRFGIYKFGVQILKRDHWKLSKFIWDL